MLGIIPHFREIMPNVQVIHDSPSIKPAIFEDHERRNNW